MTVCKKIKQSSINITRFAISPKITNYYISKIFHVDNKKRNLAKSLNIMNTQSLNIQAIIVNIKKKKRNPGSSYVDSLIVMCIAFLLNHAKN